MSGTLPVDIEAIPARKLVRGLGLAGAISVNITNMIGTGVFLKARVMTCNVQTPWSVLMVWVAGGALTLAGSACLAELGALLPAAGGEYVFLRRAYGRAIGFLYGWTTFFITKGGAQAALAMGFALFLNIALGGISGPAFEVSLLGVHVLIGPLTWVAIAAVWTVSVLNCIRVSASGQIALALTLVKVTLLVAVAVCGLLIAGGHWTHFHESGVGGVCAGVAPTAQGGLAGWGAALLGALWAYDGWNNVTPLAGEVRSPERTLPRTFLLATSVVAALYVIVNSTYFFVLAPHEIADLPASASVGTEVLRRAVGPLALSLMAGALMLSSFSSAHASLLAGARVPFAMAREGIFFRKLAVLSPRTHVPVNAILAQAAWGSVLVVSGSFDTITDSVVFAQFLFHAMTVGTLFVFRRTLRHVPRPYRAWGYPVVPALFIAVSVALVINTFIATPRQALLGIAMIVLGLPFYAYWARRAPT